MTRPVARPIVFAVVRSAPTPWLLLAVAAVMAAGRPAEAQTTTWTRGSNTSAWITGGNWSGGAAPTTTTVAVIDTKADLATTTIALNGDGRVAQQVLFTGTPTKYLWGNGPTSSTVNNRDLTLTQGITADETSGPAFVGYTNGTSYRLLDVVLNGSQAITNNSAATLSFGDPVGQTISGTVYTGSRIQSGSNVVGTVTFTGTGTGDIRVNGQIVNGSGTARLAVTVDRPGRSVIFTNTNTYSGDTTIAAGTLRIGSGGMSGRLGSGSVVNQGSLVYQRSDDVVLTTAISGSGEFVQAGTGVVTFGVAQAFTGFTLVDAGTLALGAVGSVDSSPLVRVAAGASFSVVDVLPGEYVVPATQTLAGDGSVVGRVSVASGATLSPGASPGTLTVSQDVTLGGGGNYNWQVHDAAGTAGSPTGWDLLSVGGVLNVAATSADRFNVNLWSLSGLGPDVNGDAVGFSPTQDRTWRIASATGGITGFAADRFTINVAPANGTGGFTNPIGLGTFSLALSGSTGLDLVFTPSPVGPTAVIIDVPAGTTQTQTQAGYPTLSGTLPVIKTGAGTLVLDAANTVTGSTTVQGGRLRLANAAALPASRLVVVAGGTGQVAPVTATSVASLDLAGGNGLVDLTSGALTISGGMTPVELVAEILEGRGDGSWTGTSGITSSTAAAESAAGTPRAVGWMDNGDGSLSTAYAAPGDTNIDWQVDILDASNFLAGGKFDTGSPAVWFEGDFSYDGVVDILDAADFFATGLYDAGNYSPAPGVSGVAAVPEPAPLGLAMLAALAMLLVPARGRLTPVPGRGNAVASSRATRGSGDEWWQPAS